MTVPQPKVDRRFHTLQNGHQGVEPVAHSKRPATFGEVAGRCAFSLTLLRVFHVRLLLAIGWNQSLFAAID